MRALGVRPKEMRTPIRSIIAVLLISMTAFGQAVEERQRAQDLLSSVNLTDKAWGVYLAGQLHDASLNELLRRQLAEARAYTDSELPTIEHSYVFVLFDALIQAGVTVPAEDLVPFKEKWRDQVLILLAREDGNEALLLAMRETALNEAQWLTINNVLLRMRSKQLFAKTLLELNITHRFVVLDHEGGSRDRGTGGGGAGDGSWALPKDFPPVGLYALVEYGSGGDVLVTKGPRDTYYQRTLVPTNHQVGWGVAHSVENRQDELLEYLAALNQTPLADALRIFRPSDLVQWHNTDDFSRQVSLSLTTQKTVIQAFLNMATERAIADSTGVKLRITPELDDQRQNKSEPLPTIAMEEFIVE